MQEVYIHFAYYIRTLLQVVNPELNLRDKIDGGLTGEIIAEVNTSFPDIFSWITENE